MRTFGNLLAFAPELWLLLGALIGLGYAWISGGQSRREGAVICLLAALGAFLALATQLKSTLLILDGVFILDGYAKFFDVVFLAAAGLTLLAGLARARNGDLPAAEFPSFVLLATLGAMLTASAGEMVGLFLSLELMSINLFLAGAGLREGVRFAQAAMTYAVAAILSSAVLLYGFAVTYGLTGETSLRAAGKALAERGPTDWATLLALVLLAAAFGLKLGVVPLQWWLADVYQGTPAPVTALISSLALLAGFAAFVRLLLSTFAVTRVNFALVLAVLAGVGMIGGSLAALGQSSVGRLLAYVTVAQVGYGLAGLAAYNYGGVTAILLFLLAVGLSNLAAFVAIGAYTQDGHSDDLRDLAGMWRASPASALVLLLALASLAGMPPLIGFFGRIFVLGAAVRAGYAWLAVIGVMTSLLLAFGLLRVIRAAFFEAAASEAPSLRLDRWVGATLGLAAGGVSALSVFLGPLSAAAAIGAAALGH